MITLDHHIVPSHERDASALWFTEILGLPAPRKQGPFAAVDLGPSTSLYFACWHDQVDVQHYAFAVDIREFAEVVERLVAAGVEYCADPDAVEPGTVYADATARGVYFRSPEGHLLEVLTHE